MFAYGTNSDCVINYAFVKHNVTTMKSNCVLFPILLNLIKLIFFFVAYDAQENQNTMYIPAVDPNAKQIKYFKVSSNMLVDDPYRNPRVKVTINSYSDFINYDKIKPHSHFIPIANTGYGMTLHGNSANEINDEIDNIISQLPDSVQEVTFYQRKDKRRFPEYNAFTGPFLKSHPPPHQIFYREK